MRSQSITRTCARCGAAFTVNASRRDTAHYCSKPCYFAAKRTAPPAPTPPERTCRECGARKPQAAFRLRNGRYTSPSCIDCQNAALRRRYAADGAYAEKMRANAARYRTEHPDDEQIAAYKRAWRDQHRDRIHAAGARYSRRHPDRERAKRAVYSALRTGKITRQPCWCGETKVDAHHHRGYAREHWLTVEWLCRTHHAATRKRRGVVE